MSDEIEQRFRKTVEEGERRLTRSWSNLLATGSVGGIDIGIGVFALLLVVAETGNHLLGALAFSIGFLALTLAKSELFTENFLVPFTTVAAERGRVPQLLRLWAGTLVMNLVGGWVIMAVIVLGVPAVRDAAIEVGTDVVERGIGWGPFAGAVLAGLVITLMTWMEAGTDSEGAKVVAAVAAAFVVGSGEVNHAIVGSLEIFGAILAGGDVGYVDWLRVESLATVGNMVGGIGLVTALRLVQVGKESVAGRRRR